MGGWREVRESEGWQGGWVTETMRLAYEARVAVRGELASPKSFPRLIHNNKDNRDKRETHPEDTRPRWDKKKPLSQRYNKRQECIFPAADETFYTLVKYLLSPSSFRKNLVMLSMIEGGEKKSAPISCIKLNEQRVNIQIKSSASMHSISFNL